MATIDLARAFLTATLRHERAIRQLEEVRALPDLVTALHQTSKAEAVHRATVELHTALAEVHDTRMAYVENYLSTDVSPDVLPTPANTMSVESMQTDVHDLCAALDLPVVARDMSPHDVVQTIVLPRIADLAGTRAAAVNILRGPERHAQ